MTDPVNSPQTKKLNYSINKEREGLETDVAHVLLYSITPYNLQVF